MATWSLDSAVTHLNHGSFGAAPTEVLAFQTELRREMETNPVNFMLRRYQPLLEISRTAVADFVGSNPDGLVFVPNATYGVNSVLRSLEPHLGSGAEIVITNHTYNACRNAAEATAKRIDGQVVIADIPFPISDSSQATDRVLAAVTDRTALVLIDHVTSPTALVLPIAEIAAALPEHITVLVDGAHAPGMLEVEIDVLASLGVDFYTANCHKWICSPKGAGFLWVSEAWRPRTYPAVISHGYNDEWKPSGSRFHAQFDWTGTDDPTARLSVARALAVMAEHHPQGWPGLRLANHELVLQGRRIVADALGVDLPVPDSMIGSLASLHVPSDRTGEGSIFDPATNALHESWRIEVPVFAWPDQARHIVRISAQAYNSLADYKRFAHAISQPTERSL